MAGAAAAGGMIGSVLAPLIVRKEPSNIPVLNTVLPCLALAGFLLTWLSVNSKYPLSPPSPSAERLQNKPTQTLGNLQTELYSQQLPSRVFSFNLISSGRLSFR